MGAPERNTFTFFPHEKQTLEELFSRYLISGKNRYLMMRDERILIDGIPARDRDIVLSPDTAVTIVNEAADPGFAVSSRPCTVVYEDDIVYVVHKDPGVIIHGDPDDSTCLAAMAAAWQKERGIMTPVRYIHRLDRETTGLVLFVKQPFFQPWFDDRLAAKKIVRTYLAACSGNARPGSTYTFRKPIGRDRHVSGKYRVSPSGKTALTHAGCLQKKDGLLLMECRLETGRTHQIRVHLADAGMPIVNDPLYGKPCSLLKHMGLWACRLAFTDPLDGSVRRVNDIPDPDFDLFCL